MSTDNKVRSRLCSINFGQPFFVQQDFGVFLEDERICCIRFKVSSNVNRLWDTSVNPSMICVATDNSCLWRVEIYDFAKNKMVREGRDDQVPKFNCHDLTK